MQLGNIIYIIKGVNRTCISLFLNNYLNSYMNSQLFDTVPFRKKLAKNQQLINIKLMHIPLFFSIMKFGRIILRGKIKVIYTSCINGENTIMDERYSQFKKIIKLHIIILNYVFKSNLPLAMFNSSFPTSFVLRTISEAVKRKRLIHLPFRFARCAVQILYVCCIADL